ncbi:MAG TPA: EAL domain-containing protein [Gammaproteobacteria bacterium]|nr:EAL domain-containing protein [Gammaproteobacteria bacterium]
MKSLGTRIAVVISVVLFCMMLAAGLLVDRQLSRSFEEENVNHAVRHARSLLASLRTLMLNGQGSLARQWLESVRRQEGVLDAAVLRRDGREAFSDLSTVEAVNDYLRAASPDSAPAPAFDRVEVTAPRLERPNEALRKALAGNVGFRQEASMLTVYLPIPAEEECRSCHGYDNAPLRGVLKMSLSTADADRQIVTMRRQLWAMALVLVLSLGVVLWLALRRSVIRPISQLRDALIRLGEGQQGIELPVERRDELGQVSRVFHEMEGRLFRSERYVRAVMDNVVDGIITINEEGIIESVNPAVSRLFGYPEEALVGSNVSLLMPEPYRSRHDGYLRRYLESGQSRILGTSREAEGLRRDGTVFPIDIAVSEMKLGNTRHFIGIIRDITELKEQIHALEYQALHDALTGLPNRVLLADRLEQAIRVAGRDRLSLALLLMDLDHFKEINDTLGHHNGDLILKQVAQRMRDLVRGSDTVARLGGDEFAILLPTADQDDARQIAEKIIHTVEQPFDLEGQTFVLGASIGIALFPGHGEDGHTLLRCADVAMYRAKRRRRGYAIYESGDDRHSIDYLALKRELHEAIRDKRLLLYYQPVVDLQRGVVTGVEALARWPHPRRGMLYPDDFIPLAEQTGLIRTLTIWVLEEAARQSQEWEALGLELRIAVNLSVHNLHDARFPDHIARILDVVEAHPTRLRLEITETAIMAGSSDALEVLNRLSAQGVRISIDDFGTGYSSLSYLKQLPVDEIKIDKSFVVGMAVDNNDAVIVRSTIDLAHNIGLKVVAEGVEDENTCQLLKGLHCDSAQGYYMSEPLSVEELMAWLRTSPWGIRQKVH